MKYTRLLFIFIMVVIFAAFVLVFIAKAEAPEYGPCLVTNWGSSQVKFTWFNGPYTGTNGAYEIEATFRVTNLDDGSFFLTGTDWWGQGEGSNSIIIAHGDFSGHKWQIDHIDCIARFPSGPISQSESGIYSADFHIMKFFIPLTRSNSAYRIYPLPGNYSLNQTMGITVNWTGCTSANPVFKLNNIVYGMAWVVYNQGCYDGQVNMSVSFWQPVDIESMSIDIYTPNKVITIPISGKWTFGE